MSNALKAMCLKDYVSLFRWILVFSLLLWFFNFILNVFLEVLDILAVLGLLSSSLSYFVLSYSEFFGRY